MTNAREARRNFSLSKIPLTKPAFRLCIKTLLIPQQTYKPIKKPVFYLEIFKQLPTFAAVLLRELLSENIDNKSNIEVRFGSRENFYRL